MPDIFLPSIGLRIDGAALLGDDVARNFWLEQFRQSDRPIRILIDVATGKQLEEYYQRDSGTSTWKPSVIAYHTWEAWTTSLDGTALSRFGDVLYNPIDHTCTTGMLDIIRANTDGVRVALDLDRQVLGNDYKKINEAGVNGTSGAPHYVSLAVRNYLGVTYTVVFAAPAPGEVQLNTATFRTLTFNAADIAALGSRRGALRIEAAFMYEIAMDPVGPVRELIQSSHGKVLPTWRYSFHELGEPD